MAGRSRPTFTKRLKERARQEKQREKAERKQQRKLQKLSLAEGAESPESNLADFASPNESLSDEAGESSL